MNDTLLPRRDQEDGWKMWCEIRIAEYRWLYSPSDNRRKCQKEIEKELVASSFASNIGVNWQVGFISVDQADKLGSCQIVNIDWLLQKIGKGIPKSVQRKIIKREKNADIESKGKKRARESSLGDDQGNSSKKTKDEEQIKLQSMIALVDERYPTPS